MDPYNIFTNTVSNGDTLLSIVVRPFAITSIIISLKHMHSDGLDPSRQLACPPGQNMSMSGAAAAKVPVVCDTKSDDIVDPTLAGSRHGHRAHSCRVWRQAGIVLRNQLTQKSPGPSRGFLCRANGSDYGVGPFADPVPPKV